MLDILAACEQVLPLSLPLTGAHADMLPGDVCHSPSSAYHFLDAAALARPARVRTLTKIRAALSVIDISCRQNSKRF